MKSQELYDIIKEYEANTCYIPVNNAGYNKNKVVISVETQENMNYLLETLIVLGESMEISFLLADKKLCHICKSTEHLTAQCQVRDTRWQQYEK